MAHIAARLSAEIMMVVRDSVALDLGSLYPSTSWDFGPRLNFITKVAQDVKLIWRTD